MCIIKDNSYHELYGGFFFLFQSLFIYPFIFILSFRLFPALNEEWYMTNIRNKIYITVPKINS